MKKTKKIKEKLLFLFLTCIILFRVSITAHAESGTITFDPETGELILISWDHTAEPSSATFKVDGKSIAMRTYKIDGSDIDYVKVRDLANALKNTPKKFNVTTNTKKKTLTIISGKKYIAIGKENNMSDGNDYEAKRGLTLYKNKAKINAKVYTINKEHYVAFNTLATIIGFSTSKTRVGYDFLYKIVTGASPSPTPTPTFTPSPVYTIKPNGLLKNPFPNAKMIKQPKTVDDCFNLLSYLIINNIMEYSFQTDISYVDALKEGGLSDLFKQAADSENAPELFCGAICHTNITYKKNGNGTIVTIKFEGWDVQTGNTLAKLNREYFIKTQAIVQKLLDKGLITSSMTETQKAFILYKCIVLNVFPAETDPSSKYYKDSNLTGYSAVVEKKSTSIGYTALYQLMCRYLGLTNIKAMTGTSFNQPHMWTFQELDGKKVITDVSNGFAGEGGDGFEFTPNYFGMHTTAPGSSDYYYYLKWDTEKYADYVSNFEYAEKTDDEWDDEWDVVNSDNEEYFDLFD